MAGFDASLKVGDDQTPLAARVEVNEGRLALKASDQLIGDWGLKELDFQRVANGFKVDVEGEQILLEMADTASFEEAVGFKRKGGSRSSRKVQAKTVTAPSRQATGTAVATAPGVTAETTGGSLFKTAQAKLDALLARAEKSYGSLLPKWVFTRGTVIVIFLVLVLGLIIPTIVSTLLLFSGFAVVVFGAVLYTDDALAVKLLPGRATATHVLIAGVGLLVVGFFLAVVT